MLKDLAEMEDLMKGNDLKEMQGMLDVAKEYVDTHLKGFDKIKGDIETLDRQATDFLTEM